LRTVRGWRDSIDDMGLLRHGGMARLYGRADGMKIGRTPDCVATPRIPWVSSSTANLDLARRSHLDLDTLLDDDPRLPRRGGGQLTILAGRRGRWAVGRTG
jgi:hypothetical protein